MKFLDRRFYNLYQTVHNSRRILQEEAVELVEVQSALMKAWFLMKKLSLLVELPLFQLLVQQFYLLGV
jgi:hypothetical protein